MAELVDALVSGTSIRKDVQVRVLFRAQKSPADSNISRAFEFSGGRYRGLNKFYSFNTNLFNYPVTGIRRILGFPLHCTVISANV